MRKILSPTSNDILAIKKVFGRVELDMELNGLSDFSLKAFSQKDLDELVESKTIFIEKEGSSVLGLLGITRFFKDELLGEEAKESAGFALLDEFGYKGENVITFSAFFIDPKWIGRGIAKEFISGVMSNYRETSFLIQIDTNNRRAMRFFEKMGFFALPQAKLKNDHCVLYVKPFVPQGLCREAFW